MLAGVGKGSEDVVRLIALAGDDPISEQAQKLLENRHLGGKLRRHTLAVRLVAVIRLMAEGRRFQIKRDRHRVGILFPFDFSEHRQKAVNRMGELTVLVGERSDTVKCAVDDAVSVYNEYSHNLYITFVIFPLR